MPKRFIKRFMPNQQKIRDHKHLRFLGVLLHDPNIFHLNRRSVSGAFSVGLFMAFVPIPLQMIFAAIAAIVLRVNLPISVALVWITNPLTIPPIYYFTYKVGTWILQTPVRDIQFELSTHWLMGELGVIWQPLLLGCLVTSTVLALLGNLSIRLFWRLYVNQSWRKRRQDRADKKKQKKAKNNTD